MKTLIDLIKKASRIDLTTGLFERNLSEQDRARAEIEGTISPENPKSDSEFTRRYFKRGGHLVVEDTHSSWKYTGDFFDYINGTFYPRKIVTSVYDASGKLKERGVRHLKDYGTKLSKSFVVKFNPPGSIIGKRLK